MACVRCTVLAIASFVVLLAGTAHGADFHSLPADLYGDPLPPGAVMRLGTIRLRQRCSDVTFSKDGRQLISCCNDGEVRIWDALSGKQVRRFRLWKPRQREGTWYVSLAPDGAIAAAVDGKTLYLYDTRTGQERDRLIDARMLAFSPDGRRLAVQLRQRNGDHPLRLLDIVGFEKHLNLDVPSYTTLIRAAFSLDAKQLAALGDERGEELLLWDLDTGKLRKRKQFRVPMLSLAYAPDGTSLAVGMNGEFKAVLLAAASLKEQMRLPVPANLKDPGFIRELIFSPDGRLLAADCGDMDNPAKRGILLWDLSNRTVVRWLPMWDYVHSLAFAPDSKTLVFTVDGRSEIRLWDIAAGRHLHRWPAHDTPAQTLAISANGHTIASGDLRKQLRLWDATTGAPLRSLQGVDERMQVCLFSLDDKRVITAGTEGTFQVWDVSSGKEIQHINIDWHGQGTAPFPDAAAISADGKSLAAIVADLQSRPRTARLLIWDLATGKKRMQRPYTGRVGKTKDGIDVEYLHHAAISPDGELMTVWVGDGVGIEECATGALLTMLPQGVCKSIQFAPDGRFVAVPIEQPKTPQGGGRSLSLIEVSSGEELVRLEKGDFTHTAFTPDGRALVVADATHLRVWDALTGERLHEMVWPQEVIDGSGKAKVWSLAVLPDGRAATGMVEGDILLWDLEPAKWPRPEPRSDLGRKEFDALWSDMAGDTRRAYRAVSKLAMSPVQTIAFLKDRLQPVTQEPQRIEKLLADLDSDSFAIREAASGELVRMRYRVLTQLRGAVERSSSLEMRRRLKAILAEPKPPPAEALRMLRAIALLERIGTPEARRILEKLACGAASPETREAQRALQRQNPRDTSARESSSP